jgi:predicted nucleic acid-binding protein
MLILDTDAYSALRRAHAGVARHVRESREIGFSAVVLGEVLTGFRLGGRFEANMRALEELLSHARVRLLPVRAVTADWFSKILSDLRRRGRPIPTNDVWIAAQAMEYRADLLSFDKHYGEIEGLSWIRP